MSNEELSESLQWQFITNAAASVDKNNTIHTLAYPKLIKV